MENYKMGWMPDAPDFRDLTLESPEIQAIFSISDMENNPLTLAGEDAPVGIPAIMDLRAWCSPIENQGGIGSCTANAGVGLLEYYQRRAFNKYVDASRLFLYKTTRNLLHWTGDTGAYLRTTMKAMAAFGVCPEEYWPYSDSQVVQAGGSYPPFDIEPSSFCYTLGSNYKSIVYYRLDPSGTPRPTVLANIKNYVAAGLPSMFGFTVYSSYTQGATTGRIPHPVAGESVVGGHAVVIVGYDDNMVITNTPSGVSTTGAFLIRNSWGTGWGMSGYGYLPYQYVLSGLATDFWSLTNANFFNTGAF